MIPRVQQVIRQTRERVDEGNTHAPGKIVSLFEPQTEIIRKGKAGKPTEFGKMVKVQEAEQQIVTHYEVYDQRPSDSELLIPSLDVHEQRFGHLPRLVTADAGFFSARNEAAAYAIRIDVAEELGRLGSHLDEIDRLLAKGGEVGKRLEFLIQELLREANTLGSKSTSIEMTAISVDMKVAIEQLREQVQNVE